MLQHGRHVLSAASSVICRSVLKLTPPMLGGAPAGLHGCFSGSNAMAERAFIPVGVLGFVCEEALQGGKEGGDERRVGGRRDIPCRPAQHSRFAAAPAT